MSVGTVRIGAIAISPRPGQIRLGDVLLQVGAIEELTVRMIDAAGVEREVHVRMTQKWGASSWRPALQCLRCHRAAAVLHLEGEQTVCGRCTRVRSNHHRFKNCHAWASGDKMADAVARLALRGRSDGASQARLKRLGGQLKRRTLAEASIAVEAAERLALSVDKAFGVETRRVE